MHDFMTGYDLKRQFSSAHIFILPSIYFSDGCAETQGVVLQEAQASGVPIIGSSAGGIPDVIIDGVTGLVFEQNDHNDLANKISILIQDEALYKNLCIAGRRDAEERFSTTVTHSQLISVYEEILGPRFNHTSTDTL
jgi:glycosyltransferase involved in cell wall biosynthesis